jgi:hypothetical protein
LDAVGGTFTTKQAVWREQPQVSLLVLVCGWVSGFSVASVLAAAKVFGKSLYAERGLISGRPVLVAPGQIAARLAARPSVRYVICKRDRRNRHSCYFCKRSCLITVLI